MSRPVSPKPILVTQSAAAPFADGSDLLFEVVEFVNRMASECGLLSEVPRIARQAYNADYYYTQVCNGGHAQFAQNLELNTHIMNMALEALGGAGLDALADCLAKVTTASTPGDYRDLDDRFFAAHQDFYAQMAKWLAPHLTVVPDDRYADELAKLWKRDQRRIDRDALRLHRKCLDADYMAVAGAVETVLGNLREIGPGTPLIVAGKPAQAFVAHLTDERTYFALKIDGRFRCILCDAPPSVIADDAELDHLVMMGGREVEYEFFEDLPRVERADRACLAVSLLWPEEFRPQDISTVGLSTPALHASPDHSRVYAAGSFRGEFWHFRRDAKRLELSRLQNGEVRKVAEWSNSEVRRALDAFDARMSAV